MTAPLPRGTVLLRVPRSLVLDSAVIQSQIEPDKIAEVRKALGNFEVHLENFWIVLQLLRCKKAGSTNKWAPWLAGMPQKFPEFSQAEQECLPFYARYIAEYQEQKFQSFCQAAATLGEMEDCDIADLKWAFQAVNSRFWKTESVASDAVSRSELVPIGDMFNHRDPHNVAMVPLNKEEGEYIAFVWLDDKSGGDTSNGDLDYPKNLFITYGQPSNPHRFLVIFGFVPTDMPNLWSHLILTDNNPHATDVNKMVFGSSDGSIPQNVWDAVLHEIQEPYKSKWHAADFLNDHVTKQLEELANLRQKIDALEGQPEENLPLLRQHNEFLTTVFGKVKANLNDVLKEKP